MPDSLVVQSLTPADRDALLTVDQAAFGFDTRTLDPVADTAWVEWDRAFAVRRGGAIAGINVVFSYQLTTPARAPGTTALVPMAGLSWVAVHPDHRRQGVLRTMMLDHLQRVHEDARAEPLSGLFASEPGIYGRFGYGLATESRRYTLPARSPLRTPRELGDVVTRFEAADPAKHDSIVARVYQQSSRRRPGCTIRPPVQWHRHLQDPVARRPSGKEPLKIVVAERAGEPTGYAVLRREQSWGADGPTGTVQVLDAQAADDQSSYAVWRRALDLDLMREVTTPGLPLDHPLAVWASESRAGSEPGFQLWVRIVDLPGALGGRGYSTDVDVVLDVSDALCPWNAGRWRLSTGPDGATCDPTKDRADLAVDVRELGSVYLGGTTLLGLAAAGLVDECRRDAVATASAAFRSPVLPATPYMF